MQATKAEVDEVARDYWQAGVRHIVALRGDPSAGVGTSYSPHPGGYANAADLVAGLKQIGNFEVSVAGYPEKHPESASLAADLDNLKAKVDAGANRIITQFFFDNAHYLRFLEAARARGIWVPIVPGIVPIHNFKQVAGFAGRCGATMPSWLARRFDGLDDDPQTTPSGGGRRGRRAGHGPGRSGHPPVPFLHAEPRRPRLRHLPPAGPAADREQRRRQPPRRPSTHDPRATHRRAEGRSRTSAS